MNHTDYMTGAELQALREACGLDRDQFGEMCGVQGRSIKYWEMGQTNHGVPADVEALVTELATKVDAATATQLAAWKPGQYLLRTSNAMQNQVISRVFRALRQQGHHVRIVSLDFKAFNDWMRSNNKRDTPEARQEWARRALKEQAKQHRQDQPV